MKGAIMKLKVLAFFVCVMFSSLAIFAEGEQIDFGYWRLKPGSYEYTIQRTVASNSADCVGYSFSLVFGLTIKNMTNRISVSFNDVISENAVALGPIGKEELGKTIQQMKKITGVYKVDKNNNKLEVEESSDKFASDYLRQLRNLLAFPTPRKLVEGVIWTNSAALFSSAYNHSLVGHNGVEGQFIISSPSVKEHEGIKEEKKSGFFVGDAYIVIDQRIDQITLLSLGKEEGLGTSKQTLKFIEDIKKE
jgi:hypothetical protein